VSSRFRRGRLLSPEQHPGYLRTFEFDDAFDPGSGCAMRRIEKIGVERDFVHRSSSACSVQSP